MKKWIPSLFAAVLISGCSTIPSSPKPHPEKYTFQVISIEIPGDMPEYHNKADKMRGLEFTKGSSLPTSLTIPSRDSEKLIQHPEAEITEYPIVLAGLGESVTNDQTKATLFPEDYTIVDGQAIPKEKIIGIGLFTSVTVEKIENEAISFHINASDRKFKEWQKYPAGDGLIIKMPFFNMRAIDTHLMLKTNEWVTLGGLVGERSEGKKMSSFMGIRIIPPITDK
jgi:hypothetical protein